MLGQNPKVAKQEKKKMGWAKSICTITRALSILCPPLARRKALRPTLKSFVILAFSNKAT